MSATTALIALGLTGQALYSLRGLVQWAASERAKASVVPAAYWWVTVLASTLIGTYAALQGDPILLIGPVVSLALALRNLGLQAGSKRRASRLLLVSFSPLLVASLVAVALDKALRSPEDRSWVWVGIGVLGQGLWTLRFVVQWWSSERAGQSVLPAGFWWLTIGGSLLLASYALHRTDWVFVLAYAFSPIPALRNLTFIRRAARGGMP